MRSGSGPSRHDAPLSGGITNQGHGDVLVRQRSVGDQAKGLKSPPALLNATCPVEPGTVLVQRILTPP